MVVSKGELLKIRDEIQHSINIDENFRRISEILDELKNPDNVYLINVYKIVFQTSKDSLREDPTVRGFLPFDHFSEAFLECFEEKLV